jgi:hypothetical protein
MADKIKNSQHFIYPVNGRELKENSDFKTLRFPEFESNQGDLINLSTETR